MIFVANVLTMNGGTTFLMRTSRELARRGLRATILLLSPRVDEALHRELGSVATIIDVSAFSTLPVRGLLSVFAPIDWARLRRALPPAGVPVHAMGIFGLWFAHRLCAADPGRRLSVGVYHQNEFMYRVAPGRFTDGAQALFRAVPDANLLFFNDATRDHYAAFFGRSYASAPVLPIGIDIPPAPASYDGPAAPVIVSVGNLVDFKTYNRHVIAALPALRAACPGIRYRIVGRGPEEPVLRRLATDLGVADVVEFVGQLPYGAIAAEVTAATVFVGSGTALLEAAAVGVPALIGIESLDVAESYGFLSDIPDLSYNEHVEGRARIDMTAALLAVLRDREVRARIGEACRRKAEEFGVAATVTGLLAQVPRLEPVAAPRDLPSPLTAAVSCLMLGVRDRVSPATAFAARRNQSFTAPRST
ncbi:MAG: glycosyltransferase family 4 protein [Gemmatimonadaceae bacterium]|nr:glycosyltransferase family 4 protein [Gemmatimonadaceae bacterium]